MSSEQLEILATKAGLSVDWVDANGRNQRVSEPVLRTVLGSLGLPADSPGQVEASLEVLQKRSSTLQLPPLLTVDHGQRLDLSEHFSPGTAFEILQEDGSTLAAKLDAEGYLPAFAGIGYQNLRINGQSLTLAVSPAQCYGVDDALTREHARAWGLAVQLYSLRRPGDGGLGDTQALETLVRSAAERGAHAVAISPLHAMRSTEMNNFSPYSPSSRVFFNSLHCAPGSILGERALHQALENAQLDEEFKRLEHLELIDWPAAASAKQKLLRTLFNEFRCGANPLQEDYDSFRHSGGEALENHCRFEAMQAFNSARGESLDWRQWPEAWRDPRSDEVARFAGEHADEVAYYVFCQWLIGRGLERAQQTARSSGMGIGLIADLAVGADGSGSQAWSRQSELLSSLTVGAPPDILNRSGQGWGISAFSPDGLRRHGFRAFIEMLRANFAHAGGVRIDHIMGLQRLWVIPEGSPPHEGAYLNYPLQDLLRLLALESWRHKAIVVGEDLGTVPEGFREKLVARGVLGIRVLLFEQDGQHHFKPILDWTANALATSTTHDLPTLKGWWESRDIDWNHDLALINADTEASWRIDRQQERAGLRAALSNDAQNFRGPGDESAQIIDASVRFLGHTRAPLVLLPIEDALGLLEQANLPGTVSGHPNWSRRLPGDTATLLDHDPAAQRLHLLATTRKQAHERDR